MLIGCTCTVAGLFTAKIAAKTSTAALVARAAGLKLGVTCSF